MKFRAPIACAWVNRSLAPITATRDVFFDIVITSLPVGGTMTRIAWGSTMRRIVRRLRHAERVRGLRLAGVHGLDSAADDFGHVGGLVERQRQQRGAKRCDQGVGVGTERPESDAGKISARLNQSTICTSSGVPRKSHRYAP